ncbi:hypothetical protein SVI_3420 [Shewanella violacea DSS12]|uniref:Uncharacterized protein n=1 Tax=Shewanella violacea (strain JCM 10179 / CIP 106290 / LMG 19151 / DSS12) TaxID=637905 RepID=D4ZBJ6_SHEVD|nr:hypothetical protein SVI_3420 [Shewanella violacea DSS12]
MKLTYFASLNLLSRKKVETKVAMVTQWFIEKICCHLQSKMASNNSTPVSVHTDFLFCIVKERGAK